MPSITVSNLYAWVRGWGNWGLGQSPTFMSLLCDSAHSEAVSLDTDKILVKVPVEYYPAMYDAVECAMTSKIKIKLSQKLIKFLNL